MIFPIMNIYIYEYIYIYRVVYNPKYLSTNMGFELLTQCSYSHKLSFIKFFPDDFPPMDSSHPHDVAMEIRSEIAELVSSPRPLLSPSRWRRGFRGARNHRVGQHGHRRVSRPLGSGTSALWTKLGSQ